MDQSKHDKDVALAHKICRELVAGNQNAIDLFYDKFKEVHPLYGYSITMILFGVDTGGTFTDLVYQKNGQLHIQKQLSTPNNPARAVLNGIDQASEPYADITVVHGTTVATNALLERKGAKTALITNQGFEDIIEIARQNRNQLYALTYVPTPVLIPRELRFGVSGRMDYAGNIIETLDERQIQKVMARLEAEKVESIVVALLFAFKNNSHEKQIASLLSPLGIPVSLSHEILNEFREYERVSTTAINAYVSPKLSKYLNSLTQTLETKRLRVMQSNGGTISAEIAGRQAVRTILSGPAGGVVGSFEIGRQAGFSRLITFDMGGTSTDVALVDKAIPFAVNSSIGGLPINIPVIDIHTVGAGGGSIARIDTGGSLTVGPESAGADPGPICFGKGAHLTVTDANLFLGRLMADSFLGGKMTLYKDKVNSVIQTMANQAGLGMPELAEGVLAVANIKMVRAIRKISVERGIDPAVFTLFAFGGAGGMHAAFLAKILNMSNVCVPKNPGVLSAMGMLLADVVKDYSKTVMLKGEKTSSETLRQYFTPMLDQAYKDLALEGIPVDKAFLEKILDMRYAGQSYEICVPFSDRFNHDFHECHQKEYGYCNPKRNSEIVTIRLRAIGVREKSLIVKHQNDISKVNVKNAIKGVQTTIFDSRQYQTPVYQREKLLSGHGLAGPAIIAEYSSTIVIPPWAEAEVDSFENLIIHI